MKVLAVDPGKRTGLALWVSHTDELAKAQPEHQSWIEDWQPAMATIEAWVPSVDLLVVERFTISQGTVKKAAEAGWSMGGIGVCQYLAAKAGTEILLQSPSDAMNFAPRAKLERLGWRKPGPDHADDATRHLVLALTNRRLIDLQRLLPPEPGTV